MYEQSRLATDDNSSLMYQLFVYQVLGLSDVEAGVEASASPEFTETYIISTPASSVGSANSSPAIRCKVQELKMSPPSYCSSNLSTDDELDVCTEIEKDDEDRTPVLSRENSSVEKKPIAYIEWKPAKRYLT